MEDEGNSEEMQTQDKKPSEGEISDNERGGSDIVMGGEQNSGSAVIDLPLDLSTSEQPGQ